MRLGEALGRYLLFYAVTSLVGCLGRAGWNLLLILLFGAPLLRLLRRLQSRFHKTIYGT
ncbi:MAG: hypothetical protein U9Q78_07665 [Chloroflexota bacterium]|nr:hypothetical protein [Chloroflexota bacterium]